MRGKKWAHDSWQGGKIGMGRGTKQPWSPRFPTVDAGHWDSIGGFRFRRGRPGLVMMLVMLLLMCVAGVYISAVFSSSANKSLAPSSSSSISSSRRTAGIEAQAQGSIESKGLLSGAWWSHSDSSVEEDKSPPQTLVLYIFSNTDPEYINNLRFYVRTAIHEDDGCHHVIVVNSGPDSPEVDMPELPSNAKYLHHANECFDWGTFGWALKQESVQVRDYKYFIFLNSSVRGPFLPPYLQGKMHYSELMTGMLNADDAPNSIKLAGPSINCEGTVRLPGGLQRSNPHVQSFALATDQTGMQLLIDDGKVFGCYSSIDETIYHSELGSSDAILRAGYNIASFMSRYQGVNWLDEATWNCNDGVNPFNWGASDIYSLQPMELMFVKVKHWPYNNGYPSMLEAAQYDAWSAAAEKGEQDVGKHMLKEKEWEVKAARVLTLVAKGPECWDCKFYKTENADLAELPCYDAFAHFVNYGQFEPSRPFRYTCESDWEQHGVPFQPDSMGGTLGWPLITASSCQPGALVPDVQLAEPLVSDSVLQGLTGDGPDEDSDGDDDAEDDGEDGEDSEDDDGTDDADADEEGDDDNDADEEDNTDGSEDDSTG